MKREGEDSLPSPAKSSTWSNHGDSMTADMTPANDDHTYFVDERNMTVRTERAITLYHRVQILVGVSISSLGAFSIFVLPVPALIALLVYLGSLALVGNLCIRWIMSEIQAMMNGKLFLIDEISLAEDSVLERLNSVLEAEKTLLVPEKGGEQAD